MNSRRENLKLLGICVACGKSPSVVNRVMCEVCADKVNKSGKINTQRRVSEGKCRKCGNPSMPNFTHCELCLTKKKSKRDQRIKDGLCTQCGNFLPDGGRTMCIICQAKATYSTLVTNARNRNHMPPDKNDYIDAYLNIPNSRCAICNSDAYLHIDHDHKTGQVRGILCARCNTAIGLLNESEELFNSAIQYLKDSKEIVKNGANLP